MAHRTVVVVVVIVVGVRPSHVVGGQAVGVTTRTMHAMTIKVSGSMAGRSS